MAKDLRSRVLATAQAANTEFKVLLDKPLTPYYTLISTTAILLGIGLLEVLSASSVVSYKKYDNSYYWFFRQLIWVAGGLLAGYVVLKLPRNTLRKLAWVGLAVTIVLLVLTHFLGSEVNGNTNWIGFGAIKIQPSELAKLVLILWIADLYQRKAKLLHLTKHVLIPVVPVAGLVIALVLWGGDLGTALIFFAVLLGLLWTAGTSGKLFLTILLGTGFIAGILAITNGERLSRLTTFLSPFDNFSNDGWQTGHGLLGMASGGIFGKGIGASAQKWGSLPYPYTDSIFAVLGEELGLFGTLLVLLLFAAFAWAGFRIARDSSDLFVKYAATGITLWVMVQMLINVGMMLALLPVIGVPLPLVSYGGSSLVPILISIALLVSFAKSNPSAAQALAQQPRRGGKKQPAVTGVVTANSARLRSR